MDLSKIYSPRPEEVHKGNYGSVLVVCGSKLYSGSATLASISALRAGADLVTVVAPERAANIAANTLCDLITYPLGGSYLSTSHIREIFDIAKLRRINSIVLGCGLGRHRATVGAIEKLIYKFTIPLVIDADALYIISNKSNIFKGKHVVLTPHLFELATILSKQKIEDTFESRLSAAKEAALKYSAIVLLKGHIDIVTDGAVSITNNSGTAFMTKGGFGDTLCGICGALLARGVGILEAAHAAAYINGKAGELASEKYGEGVVASDIFNFIPEAIMSS